MRTTEVVCLVWKEAAAGATGVGLGLGERMGSDKGARVVRVETLFGWVRRQKLRGNKAPLRCLRVLGVLEKGGGCHALGHSQVEKAGGSEEEGADSCGDKDSDDDDANWLEEYRLNSNAMAQNHHFKSSTKKKATIETSLCIEWFPALSQEEIRSKKGFQDLWVCTHPLCGQAFAEKSFLRMHQESYKHGSWKCDEPLPNSRGKLSVQQVDCTCSGHVTFSCPSVEKKLRKLVRQCTKSEEPRIDVDTQGPWKVLHTGHRGKGWGLFSTRYIAKGEYIGHYSGIVVDLGSTKRFTGHYTFGLIHGLALDGTSGGLMHALALDGMAKGAMRFINHCLEDSEPNVRALILNHYGVPHVSLYAATDIADGGELSLRYNTYSDAEFFASPCGLD